MKRAAVIISVCLNVACIAAAAFALFHWRVDYMVGRFRSPVAVEGKDIPFADTLLPPQGCVLFIGDSLVANCPWPELFTDLRIVNRGVGAETTDGLLKRTPNLMKCQPSKVFLMIGINDLQRGSRPQTVAQNIKSILDVIRASSPNTKTYLHAILPVNARPSLHTTNRQIEETNEYLKEFKDDNLVFFVDLHRDFLDADGNMSPAFTNSGIHLTPQGYRIWHAKIAELVASPSDMARIAPQPVQP